MAKGPLGLAVWGLAALGAAAVLYVIGSALGGGPDASLARFAKGEMRNLVVLDAPPPQPTAAFRTREGAETTLAAYRGRVVLVNFWATWCAPCVKEMPSLDRLEAAAPGGDRFAVAPISLDRSMQIAADFYAEAGLGHLPLYVDNTMAIAKEAGAPGLPVSIFYGPDGRELARVPREAEWDSPEALALVEAVIAEAFPRAPD